MDGGLIKSKSLYFCFILQSKPRHLATFVEPYIVVFREWLILNCLIILATNVLQTLCIVSFKNYRQMRYPILMHLSV